MKAVRLHRDALAFEAFAALAAVRLLTRIPVARSVPHSEALTAASARYFPAVGVLVGALSALAFVLAAQIWGQPVAALVALCAGVMLTGAFHEDGFADCCDGLGGGLTGARALEIMRDSRLGTYGTLGLIFLIGGKALALASLPLEVAPWALIAAHAGGRASSTLAAATGRTARAQDDGRPTLRDVSGLSVVVALATGLAALAPLGFAAPAALVGLAVGHVVMRLAYERKLGGYTGDCLGAVEQAGELSLLLAVAAWAGWF